MLTERLKAETEQLATYFFPIWLENFVFISMAKYPSDFIYADGESSVSLSEICLIGNWPRLPLLD